MLKLFENYLDARGLRGSLRRLSIYQAYLILKGVTILANPFMFKIYSRAIFRRIIAGNDNDVYSQYFRSFRLEPENGLANLNVPDRTIKPLAY